MGLPEHYHITERWRGVEQPLDPQSYILDIWNAWGTAQPEVNESVTSCVCRNVTRIFIVNAIYHAPFNGHFVTSSSSHRYFNKTYIRALLDLQICFP